MTTPRRKRRGPGGRAKRHLICTYCHRQTGAYMSLPRLPRYAKVTISCGDCHWRNHPQLYSAPTGD